LADVAEAGIPGTVSAEPSLTSLPPHNDQHWFRAMEMLDKPFMLPSSVLR
jgi:hypothetical protein